MAAALALTATPPPARRLTASPARRLRHGRAGVPDAVDGLRVLACQTLCRAGMQIETSGANARLVMVTRTVLDD